MNLRLNRSSDVVGVCFAAVGFALLLPWLIGTGAGSSAEIDESRERIEQMSSDTRRHLEANFAAYEKAPPYLREEFKEIYEAIEQDPELAEMLTEYCAWVQSLPPDQQAELRQPNEPAKRLQLVKKYLHRIPAPPEPHPHRPGAQPTQHYVESSIRYINSVLEYVERDHKLSRDELDAVIALFEQQNAAGEERSADEASGPIWQRGLAVLDERSRRSRPLTAQQREEFRRMPNRVLRMIQTPAVVKELTEVKNNSPAQFQQRLRQILMRSLLDVLIDDLTRGVTADDLQLDVHKYDAIKMSLPKNLTQDQRDKRIALYYRLTFGRRGYEDQIGAFRQLIPRNYLGRERLREDGFPPRPGFGGPPRGEKGPPFPEDRRPPFDGPLDGRRRMPPEPFSDGDRRETRPPR